MKKRLNSQSNKLHAGNRTLRYKNIRLIVSFISAAIKLYHTERIIITIKFELGLTNKHTLVKSDN